MTPELAYRSGMDAALLELIPDWLAVLNPTILNRTVPQYETMLKKFLFFSKILDIKDINYHKIQTYINSLSADGLSPSTVHNYHAAISNFCRYLVDRGLSEFNLCLQVRLPGIIINPPRYLSEEQECRLIGWSKWYGIFFPIFTALRTAMRLSEIRRMKWEDIDFIQNTITIYDTKQPKRRKFRIIPLHSELKKELLIVRQTSGLVWHNKAGKIWSTGTWEHMFWQLKPHFPEVEGLGFQILRSTCATRMVQKGVPLEIVSKILGHANLQMTIDHYAALAPQNLQKGIEVL